MIRCIWIVAVAIGLFAGEARGEWSFGQGEYRFAPEISEAEACKHAERRAREKAVQAITGERLSTEDLMSCSDRREHEACILHRHTWRLIDGEIRGIRNRKEKTLKITDGLRKCVVSLEADVVIGKGKPDPGFDFSVEVNQPVFRSGEKIRIKIKPNELMYISVFQWLPYEKGDRQVIRIFPNLFDTRNKFQTPFTVPTAAGQKRYDLRVGFPESYQTRDKFVDEFLMVIGTRAHIKFREVYRLEEFKSRLLEMERHNWRRVKEAYSVMRSK